MDKVRKEFERVWNREITKIYTMPDEIYAGALVDVMETADERKWNDVDIELAIVRTIIELATNAPEHEHLENAEKMFSKWDKSEW